MKSIVALAGIGAILLGGWYLSKPHYSAGGTPNEVNTQFQKALQSETDPAVLRAFAAELRAKGYSAQAVALETKAATIEANNRVLPGPGGTTVPTVTPTPSPIPTTPPVTVTPGGGVQINIPVVPTDLGGIYVVKAGPPTYALNLRSSPDNTVGNNIIVGLQDNMLVTQIGGPTSSNGISWVKVRTVTGQEGWVASQYLVKQGLAA